MANKKRLFVIDGNALLHRAWHAIPPLATKDGTIVNAAYGFAMVLDRLILDEKPDYLAVCWDVEGGTFRDEVYEDYKATRERKEQELYDQIDFIDRILDAHNVPTFGIEGYEADDLIGTVAEHVRKKKDIETVIVTGDLDALQLVDESTVVSFFVKGLSVSKIYDVDAVEERYGFGPEFIVDYKALRGDASDNIPGVKGIGEKTATELIKTYGGLDEIYKKLKKDEVTVLKTGALQKMKDGEKDAYMSQELATIVRDVDMDFSMKDAEFEVPDWNKVLKIYREYEFTTLSRRIEARQGIVESNGNGIDTTKATKKRPASVKVVVDRDGSKVEEAMSVFGGKEIAIDVRDHAMDLFGSSITAIALSNGKKSFVFASPTKETIDGLKSLLEDGDLITHDLKRVLHLMDRVSVSLSRAGLDLRVASYLAHAGSRRYDLDVILPDLVPGSEVKFPKSYESDEAYKVLGNTVALFMPAAKELRSRLKEAKMEHVYSDMEQPLIGILSDMERFGVLINPKALEAMSKKMDKTLKKLSKEIWFEAGREFNINSPAQLADILFDELELPTKGIKKTQKGYSTAAPMLEKLRDEHPIVPLIGKYRELAKLKSTYVDALPALADKEGRVHTTYNQTVAATGRLSSTEPNLQNIPIRTDLGREIRKAFVAPKGRRLVAADYSQIELRLVAALSKDKAMVKIFKDGGDIHRATAAKVFGVDEDAVTKKQRRAAKAVNFGIIYGMGARALSRNIEVSYKEAKEFIDKYFEVFPGVRKYLDKVLEVAKEKGYAESYFGRRRYLPDLNSGVQMVRAGAERMAKNMPLQGTASDIMKMAMIEVASWLEEKKYGNDAVMIMQVHDELVFEVKNGLVEEVSKGVKKVMEEVASFDIPLTVEVEAGDNWMEME